MVDSFGMAPQLIAGGWEWVGSGSGVGGIFLLLCVVTQIHRGRFFYGVAYMFV